jgi:hypothetical protein
MNRHDYVGYTKGCRCVVCKAAKRAYMRALRAHDRSLREWTPAGLVTPLPIKHGISGYQNHGCRCQECRDAKAAADRRQKAAREAREAS